MVISQIRAYEILNSLAIPTIECVMEGNGFSVRASVPIGTSRGEREAHMLVDGDKSWYKGHGVSRAIEMIHSTIRPVLVGKELSCGDVDRALIELDGTQDKKNLGANTTLAVSIAAFKADAAVRKCAVYELIADMQNIHVKSFPRLMFNVVNGGLHGAKKLSVQEFLVVCAQNQLGSVAHSLHDAAHLYHELGKRLERDGVFTGRGSEGGFAPFFSGNIVHKEQYILSMLSSLLEKKALKTSFSLFLDVAASHCYESHSQTYCLGREKLSRDELIERYGIWCKEYSIDGIEDGLAEHDWDGWSALTRALGGERLVIGDDFFATNRELLEKGVERKSANAIVIKPNQIGTVSEALEVARIARSGGYAVVVSHRSGETCDSFITDFAVGVQSDFFKAGAPIGSERLVKYNRLIEIETFL